MSEINKKPYYANKIIDDIWSIEEGGVRCFLIEGTDKAMLVDTGFGGGDIKSFAETLTYLPIFLINTHTDVDHIGCNDSFEKVMMHQEEEKYYQMKKPDNHAVVEPLEDGDVIDIGTRKFEVIHIPGHTPGSIALLDRNNKLLISGDSVQTGAVFMFGKGRDINMYIESMKKLDKMKTDFETILPSHGDIPIKADIIPELIEGAERILKGEIEGQTPPRQMPCKLYIAGRVKFLYSDDPAL